jgi:polyhydroxyalkanoate synthesis repressor PhaR
MQNQAKKPAIIKKYPNRRLYDTITSSYITLDDLCERVKAGDPFVVVDAKSGQDLTRQILTQIIFEQETKGLHLLPTEFLRSVISFYDNNMNDVLQPYLNASMKSFVENQVRVRGMMGNFSPLNTLEEATHQNVAFFEKTMQMFNPFSSLFANSSDEKSTPATTGKK